MVLRLSALVAFAALALPAVAGSADGWTSLRRPLHLPKVAPAATCPVSKIDRRVDWTRMHIFGGFGIGRGPVYPGLPSGSFVAMRDQQYGSKWFGEKVFWFVVPSYRGRVLIRGRRIDAPGRMGFNGARTPNAELRVEPYDTVGWSGQPRYSRGIPSAVRVLEKGCYAFQIDGTTFSRTVVVAVDVAS
jgi:hypothetical protein